MRKPKPRQLYLAFADSPQGGDGGRGVDGSTSKPKSMHTAKSSQRTGSASPGASDPGRVLERVADRGNLAMALEKVASNKGAPGVDKQTVVDVVQAKATILPKLRDALLAETYVPGDVRRVWIPKPGGGRRGLGIPNVVDRVVQQAVLQVLQPVYEPTFHDSSHGFRPGRGARTAIAEAAGYVTSGRRFTVDIDLSKFFDRVNHQRLLDRMGQRVADRRVLRLVRLMLKAKVVLPEGIHVPTEEGTPQGGPLSPLLSNIVLDELDQELARRGHCFVRYADDCNIYVGSERTGHRVMASIRRFIESRLRLRVNEEKSAVGLAHDRHFLGFRVGVNRAGRLTVELSKRTTERLAARIRELIPRNWGGSLSRCFDRLNSYVRGWMGHFRLCTSEVLRRLSFFDAHIRRRIRALVVRQKKTARHLYRFLRRHGAGPTSAWKAAYRSRAPWRASRAGALHTVLSNQWFHGRLVSLRDLFKDRRHDWGPFLGDTT